MTCAWNHPACAGSRAGAFGSSAARRDQPRVCGKQFHLTDTGKALMGSSPRVRGGQHGPEMLQAAAEESSPRVRGAGRGRQKADEQKGIIPARAGSRLGPLPPRWWRRDHPRACGEQDIERCRTRALVGSSPRVRGAVTCVDSLTPTFGIIPARAGSRPGWLGCRTRGWDHPRACGEQIYLPSSSDT